MECPVCGVEMVQHQYSEKMSAIGRTSKDIIMVCPVGHMQLTIINDGKLDNLGDVPDTILDYYKRLKIPCINHTEILMQLRKAWKIGPQMLSQFRCKECGSGVWVKL